MSEESQDHDRAWDVCIVGAGPAGLAVATALAGRGLRIAVLESGAGGQFPRVHLDAENPYPNGDVNTTHSAGIGGTANQWSFQLLAAGERHEQPEVGCRYTPMQPLDLIARPEIGTPGWPLDQAELDRWYPAAQDLSGLGAFRYDAASWTDEDNQPLPLEGTGVVTGMFQFGPAAAFTGRARDDLLERGITFLTETDALWLELSASADRVEGVRVAGPSGPAVIRARHVVLAAGGLECTRLLLDTGRRTGRTPGDHAGLLGRNFMEHPLVRGGLLISDPAERWLNRLGLYGTRRVDGRYVSARLTLADDVVIEQRLLACSALLVPRDAAYASPGALALSRLRSPSGRRDPRRRQLAAAVQVLLGAPGVLRATRAARGGQPSIDRATWAGSGAQDSYSVFEVIHQTEQSPDPDNRLRLATATDPLGRSELTLTWRWSVADRRRIARSRDLFGAALAERGIGRLVNTDYDDGLPRLLGGTHHPMGTTRMSAAPADGVVDPDTRVHGWDNLYVSSSATFPSGGFVNPTLTIVALGLRLGEHLAGTLAG